MISKEDIKDLLKSIKKYFKVAPKHLNNMYALDENQYQLINEYIEQLETDKENSISKSVIEKLLYKETNRIYEALKSDLCNEKELEYRRGRTDILQEIMKGENNEGERKNKIKRFTNSNKNS